jgi:glyoxylase-like metal-dependent hydrolase (beta-lactamase superfamily II)
MILRQLFHAPSSSYTYLIAARCGGEALLIDPVREHVDRYLRLLAELELRLVRALDTHLHADRFSGLAALSDRTGCVAAMSERTASEVVSLRLTDAETVLVDGLRLRALATPGHTPDSMCFLLDDMAFTGDTLLIRGTGRTDLPGGDAAAQYESLFGRLLRLPESTRLYPAHDYNGATSSTIGEERRYNPRLQVRSRAEYVAQMAQLKLPKPALMEEVLPANLGASLLSIDCRQ